MSQPTQTPTVPATRRWFDAGPLMTFRQEVDNLLENLVGDFRGPRFAGVETPRVDLAETSDGVEVTTDVPGFKPEQIEIEMREGVLTISGKREEVQEEQGAPEKKFHRVERRSGAFSRAVWLPCAVMEDQVKAELKDGVLTVTLPKAAEARTRKIPVKG